MRVPRFIAFLSLSLVPVGSMTVRTTMQNAPAVQAETPIELQTATGVLHGALLMPAGVSQPVPVTLIIAGSGPTDRDGNSPLLPGKNNSLKMLAVLLADLNVASVRYDKRGAAGSRAAASRESDLRFSTFVEDAVAWIRKLAADSRFSEVLVLGHSEGSLIGIMAARGIPVTRVISIAGAGRTAAAVLDEQLSKSLPQPLLADARRVIAELVNGRTVDNPPAQLAALFRPSVQPYLISWLNIDPAAEAARLEIPVLVVQGTTDIQVGVTDAERLAGSGPHARLELIEGMNHVLKEVTDPAKQAPSYSDSTLPLHPGLRQALVRFLR